MLKQGNASNRRSGNKDLPKALAALIKNTRTTRRHLSLTEISSWLTIAIEELGSINEVADRIGLSVKMLRQFLYVSKLTKPVQRLFAERKIDSVDTAVHLSMLKKNDQRVVGQKVANGQLDSADVRGIVELRKKLPEESIRGLIQRIKSTRNVKQYIAEFVVRSRATDERALLRRFSKVLGKQNIISIDLEGSLGRIIMNSAGKSSLQKAAAGRGVGLAVMVNSIVNEAAV